LVTQKLLLLSVKKVNAVEAFGQKKTAAGLDPAAVFTIE
jgi:hypothetical protein